MRQYWTFVLLIVVLSIILLMVFTGRRFGPKILGSLQGSPAAESASAEAEPDAPNRIVTTTPLYEALTSAPQR